MDILKLYSKETLLSAEDIENIVDKLATQINNEYKTKKEPIVVIGLLKGATMFTCDMLRKFDFPCSLDYFWATTYVGSASTHRLIVKKDIEEDLDGKHVIVLSDSINSGSNIKVVLEKIAERKALSVKVVTLLDKPSQRKYNYKPDYVGYTVNSDKFLVGYGMDYNELFRNLPFIAALDERFYK